MLKAAQMKTKITPEGRFFPPMMPNGHWAENFADDQYASVLILEKNGTKLVWICLDVIGMDEDFSTKTRERISESLSIPIEHINIGYTHSHCAPRLGKGKGMMKSSSQDYLDFVSDKILDVCERCMKQKMEEVDVFEKNYDGSAFYSNRNGLDKTGDTQIKLLEFRNADHQIKGLVLVYACHATVVNFQNTRDMNSDLAGYLCRGLEKKTGVYPVVMLGAAGDMSNRCLRQGNDYHELIRVGEGLLEELNKETAERKLNMDEFQVDSYQFKETYVTTKAQRQAQIDNIHHQIEKAATADLKRVFNSALRHAMMNPDGGTFVLDVKGQVLRMGDLEICTMPAELFSCFGLEIKQAMQVKCPVFWGYSNYSVGYLYNKEEAGLSFESAATNIPVGATEEIVAMLKEKVK